MKELELFIKTLTEELSNELTPFERARKTKIINLLLELKELRIAYDRVCEKVSDSLTCCEDCIYREYCINEDCTKAVEDYFKNE